MEEQNLKQNETQQSKPQHTLFVCTLCRASETEREQIGPNGGQYLLDRLYEALDGSDVGNAIRLHPVRCMGVCSRSCVVSFSAPKKLTFIFSELSPTQSVPELLQFSQQYISSSTGNVPYRERPNAAKKGLVAVLPPLPAEG